MRRARHIADELLEEPASQKSQAALANKWGVSIRTLSRLFMEQTGLSFSQWRQQAKLLTSLQWIDAGLAISEVSALCGYATVSAYIKAFRERFRETPRQFQVKVNWFVNRNQLQ